VHEKRLKNARSARRKRWKLNNKPKLAEKKNFVSERKRRKNSKKSNVKSSPSNRLLQLQFERLVKSNPSNSKLKMLKFASRRSTRE